MTTDFHTYGRNIFVLRCRHSKGDTWQKIVQSIFSKNKRFSSCFQNREIEFKVQLQPMQPLKTLKLFELSWPPRKQPLNLWLFLVHLQRTLSIFCHQKTLWLGTIIFFQVSRFDKTTQIRHRRQYRYPTNATRCNVFWSERASKSRGWGDGFHLRTTGMLIPLLIW